MVEVFKMYSVKSCGEKGLRDNGRRDLDEEICARLDENYPGWKSPKGTCMVPGTFISKAENPEVGEITEKDFFDILREFGEISKEPMFVIHSYKFSEYIRMWMSSTPQQMTKTNMSNWVMGEHDFVIVHHVHGVVFFQVKSATTSGGHHEADSQIQKDKVSLERFCQKMMKAGIISNKQVGKIFDKFPAFVVLPNTQRGHSVNARDDVLYQEECTSTEAFSEWWYGKFPASKGHSKIDQTMYEYLVMRFVGMVHVSPFIGHCVDRIQEILIFKTEEQVKLLVGHYPPKLWIRGPAGSGKTVLLLEKARSLLSSIVDGGKDEKILVACFNSALRTRLQSILETPWKESSLEKIKNCLHVTTFTGLIANITSSSKDFSSKEERDRAVSSVITDLTHASSLSEKGITPFFMRVEEHVCSAIQLLKMGNSPFYKMYDHILVDEGQDLFGSKWPRLLELMHKSSVIPQCKIAAAEREDLLKPPGFFWVMYDSNQYLISSSKCDILTNEYFQNSAELKEVFRNTGSIFKQSEKYFKPFTATDTGITLGHKEDGLPIKWDTSLKIRCVKNTEVADTIIAHLRHLQSEHVRDRDICILVESVPERNFLRGELSLRRIETQSAKDLVGKNDNKIVVESVRSFKGLESKVVILVALPYKDQRDHRCTTELLYTAISRCFCYLIVITTEDGGMALKSEKGVISFTS